MTANSGYLAAPRRPGYAAGRRIEYAVVHGLAAEGYAVTRAASSKGAADVIAIKPGQVVLVSCKRTNMPIPAERADLCRIAAMLPGVGVPIVALGPISGLRYVRLTGPGPRDFLPWQPDEVAP